MYRKANGVQTERQTELQTDRVNCRGASLLKRGVLLAEW